MLPSDLYQGTRLAAAEALRDVGLRARWSFGWPQGLTSEQSLDLESLGRLHSDWASHSNEGLISLGMAWPDIYRMGSRAPETIYREEIRFARERKLPISVHASNQRRTTGHIDVMKTAREIEPARAESEFVWMGRKLLEVGTLLGARSLGLDGVIGSLTPGKRAALIAVPTRHLNMGVAPDPVNLVIEAAQAENIDTVIVDGRILKRGGVLTALASEQLIAEAAAALEALRDRTRWR